MFLFVLEDVFRLVLPMITWPLLLPIRRILEAPGLDESLLLFLPDSLPAEEATELLEVRVFFFCFLGWLKKDRSGNKLLIVNVNREVRKF